MTKVLLPLAQDTFEISGSYKKKKFIIKQTNERLQDQGKADLL